MDSKLKLRGTVELVLCDENGKVKTKRHVENLIVTAGFGFITSRLRDATSGVMSHMGVGTSSTAPAVGQTALTAQVGSRVALSSTTQTTTTLTNDTLQYTCTFGAGVGTGALQEAGIFNAASGGTMLNRVTYTTINKGASDALTITWNVAFA
jgi:hypothetical protein